MHNEIDYIPCPHFLAALSAASVVSLNGRRHCLGSAHGVVVLTFGFRLLGPTGSNRDLVYPYPNYLLITLTVVIGIIHQTFM